LFARTGVLLLLCNWCTVLSRTLRLCTRVTMCAAL